MEIGKQNLRRFVGCFSCFVACLYSRLTVFCGDSDFGAGLLVDELEFSYRAVDKFASETALERYARDT